MRKATIRDVAQLAGVAVGTVSRVLNDSPNVRVQTRDLVVKAIQELRYEPDAAARELSGLRGISIGLNVAPGTRRLTPYFFTFFENLMRHVRAGGYRFDEIENKADGLPGRLPDAMVLFGAHADDPRVDYLQQSKTPFVLIGQGSGFPSVCPDDFDGGFQAGRHLTRLAHRDILHVTSYLTYQASEDRLRGFRSALKDAGIEHDDSLVLDGDGSSLGAYRAVRRFFESGRSCSAVFATSDEMARGCKAAIQDFGLQVPADVSLVGYDDLPEMGEGLTTIHQNITVLAETALHLLQESIEGLDPRHVTLPVQLVARSTTSKRR